MTIKGTFVSVVVTHEGEQRRFTPGVPPSNPPPIPALYIAGQSCELFRFPLTASGSASASVNITGPISTLTGPQGNLLSNTLAVDVDTATGNQYVLQQNKGSPNWIFNIPVFAPNVTGNVAPIHNITGPATGFPAGLTESTFGGICLDAQKNIYAGFQIGSGASIILKFPAGSDGNATGTTIVSDTTYDITSLCYDSIHNLIWASGLPADLSNKSLAFSYSTSGVLNSSITSTNQNSAGEVFIGPAGQIILTGVGTLDGRKTIVEVFPSGSSGTNPATTQSITITAPIGPRVPCVAMDSLGLLYVGPIVDFGPGNQNINVYAAGATGLNPATQSSFFSPLFATMADGTATNIQNIVIR